MGNETVATAQKNRRGLALILVAGLLVILAYISVELVTKARISRALSTFGIDKAKARLMARSGYEKGIRAIRANPLGTSRRAFKGNWYFGGMDRNRSGDVDAGELALSGATVGKIEDADLDEALSPSLVLEDPVNPGQALLAKIDDLQRGVSALLDQGLMAVRLKVVPHDAIDVNGGIFEPGESDLAQFDVDHGLTWYVNSTTHPFNRPTINLLDALGNYYRYIHWVGFGDPAKTFRFSEPTDSAYNVNPALAWLKFIGTRSYPPLPLTSSNADLMMEGLGHFLVNKRPDGGFRSISQLEPLVRSWLETHDALHPEISLNSANLWGEIQHLLTVNAKRSPATRLWEQEGLTRLPSGRHVVAPLPANQRPDFAWLGEQGASATRAWRTTRSYRFPRQLLSINTAPIPLLTAMIHSVKDVQYRQEMPPIRHGSGAGGFESGLAIVRSQALATHENGRDINDPATSDGDFGGVNFNLFSMTESLQMARDICLRRHTRQFTSQKFFYDWLVAWDHGFDNKYLAHGSSYEGRATKYGPMSGLNNIFSYHYQMFRFRDNLTFNMRQRFLWSILNPNGDLRHFVYDEALPASNNSKENRYVCFGSTCFNGTYGIRNFRASSYLCRGTLPTGNEGSAVNFEGNYAGKIDFDKSYPHDFGCESSLTPSGLFALTSEGLALRPDGTLLAVSRIEAQVDVFHSEMLTSQNDFAMAMDAGGPGIYGNPGHTWSAYPERPYRGSVIPLGSVPPAQWDGQLALIARDTQSHYDLGISSVKSQVPLIGIGNVGTFDQKVAGAPGVSRLDPSTAPNPESLDYINATKPAYSTPWYPRAGQADRPQINSLANRHQVSHEVPGGGVFPEASASTMWYDGYHTEATSGRRLGGLVLDAVNSSNQPILASAKEGAISFFYKPRTYPHGCKVRPHEYPSTTLPKPGDYLADRGPACLFDYHFFINDAGTKSRIDSDISTGLVGMGVPLPIHGGGLYRCNIRLLWGNMWERAGASHSKFFPVGYSQLRTMGSPWMVLPSQYWHAGRPWIHSLGMMPQLDPFNNLFPFDAMKGMPQVDASGTIIGYGNLLCGNLPVNDYLTARTMRINGSSQHFQHYVPDKLWLEFKVALVRETTPGITVPGTPVGSVVYRQIVSIPSSAVAYQYTGADTLNLYENEAISFNDTSVPGNRFRHLFVDQPPPARNLRWDDSPVSDELTTTRFSTGAHTVCKSFRLDHPVVTDPTDVNFGLGPVDEYCDPMAMMRHGRWNHILIAWRNMKDLLTYGTNVFGNMAKGGCVAVYHNGTLRRSVVTGDSPAEASNWNYNGLFLSQDFFPEYSNNWVYDANVYGTTPFIQNLPPLQFWDFHGNSDTVPGTCWFEELAQSSFYYPIIPHEGQGVGWLGLMPVADFSFQSVQGKTVKGFSMETAMVRTPDKFYNGQVTPSVEYCFGALGGYSGYAGYKPHPVTGRPSSEVMHWMHHASNKLFFGGAPTGICGYDPADAQRSFPSYKYCADGAFMDIRIADRADPRLLHADGGFVANIPNYKSAPLPSTTRGIDGDNSRLFPLQVVGKQGDIVLATAWTAYLPQFHQFWDDVPGSGALKWDEASQDYILRANEPGPDDVDQMVLEARWQRHDPSLGNILSVGSWQEHGSGTHLLATQGRPRFDSHAAVLDRPFIIPADPRAMSLKLDFAVGSTPSARSCYSTPLIDDITVLIAPARGEKVLSFQWE